MGVLNVAATCVGTRALGPGLRSVVWVQGCPFRCAECLAPEWIPQQPARLVEAGELVRELLADPGVSGLTLSGGEPMAQAGALALLVKLARSMRDLTVICYSGYRLTQLRRPPLMPGVTDLLAEVDVLIDGRYVSRLNDGRGLRGSTNQRIHYLTGRLREHDFAGQPRAAELRFSNDGVFMVGVPPAGLLHALDEIAAAAPPDLGLELANGSRGLPANGTA